jgi:hypothetical protein
MGRPGTFPCRVNNLDQLILPFFMPEALAQITRTAPDCGSKSSPTPNLTVSRPVPHGLIVWLPALVVLICTPLLALVVTKFALIPPMKRAAAQSAAWSAEASGIQGTTAPFIAKIPLNTSGNKGAHTGFRSLMLVGADSDFNGIIDANMDKLAALAAGEFKDTTVSDLDKPEALNAKRAQLLADFNRALSRSVVEDVYISEWPARKP